MLVALDVAFLPPPAISQRAIDVSAELSKTSFEGLRLGADMLPHITLTQQFVESDELESALDAVAGVLRGRDPLILQVTGGGKGRSAVWMTIDRTAPLLDLHTRLMDALERFERRPGAAAAFAGDGARPGDLAWVAGFRAQSSFASFAPHITLGHAEAPPRIEPVTFVASTVAACRLGRFCTCRLELRTWHLRAPSPGRS